MSTFLFNGYDYEAPSIRVSSVRWVPVPGMQVPGVRDCPVREDQLEQLLHHDKGMDELHLRTVWCGNVLEHVPYFTALDSGFMSLMVGQEFYYIGDRDRSGASAALSNELLLRYLQCGDRRFLDGCFKDPVQIALWIRQILIGCLRGGLVLRWWEQRGIEDSTMNPLQCQFEITCDRPIGLDPVIEVTSKMRDLKFERHNLSALSGDETLLPLFEVHQIAQGREALQTDVLWVTLLFDPRINCVTVRYAPGRYTPDFPRKNTDDALRSHASRFWSTHAVVLSQEGSNDSETGDGPTGLHQRILNIGRWQVRP